MSPAGYRPDIDGLRAVAVLAVVLFHAGVPFFSGGFAGVDVFFVISGYLITQILLRDLADNTFSLWRFYERRVRRIIPALLAVIAFSLIMAWILLTPDAMDDVALSTIAVGAFSSNFFFWLNADYFSPSAELRPLLHTWSLAVEEQFYILFPVLLYVLHRRAPRFLVPVLMAITFLSVAFSQWQVTRYPEAAFYLLPARAWELTLGALVAAGTFPRVTHPVARELLAAIGLGLIAASFVLYSGTTVFPGLTALLPCVGAALLIQLGMHGDSTFAGRFLSWRPMVGVGLVSYSLYLWHWPLLAFARHLGPAELAGPHIAGLLLLAGLASVLSWRFIERPFRKGGIITTRRTALTVGSASLIGCIAIGLVIHLLDGVPSRFPAHYAQASLVNPDRSVCFGGNALPRSISELCRVGVDGDRIDFMLWGDSHAEALRSAVDNAAKEAGLTGIYIARPACAPLLGLERHERPASWRERCQKLNATAVAFIEKHAVPAVFLLGRWAFYAEGTRYGQETGDPIFLKPGTYEENPSIFKTLLNNTINRIAHDSRRIYLISSIPEIGFHVPRAMSINNRLGIPMPTAPTMEQHIERNRHVIPVFERLADRDAITVLRPAEWLCNSGTCAIAEADKPLYFDGDHLSLHGADMLKEMLAPAMTAISEKAKENDTSE